MVRSQLESTPISNLPMNPATARLANGAKMANAFPCVFKKEKEKKRDNQDMNGL